VVIFVFLAATQLRVVLQMHGSIGCNETGACDDLAIGELPCVCKIQMYIGYFIFLLFSNSFRS
jgi:hypothetical protein